MRRLGKSLKKRQQMPLLCGRRAAQGQPVSLIDLRGRGGGRLSQPDGESERRVIGELAVEQREDLGRNDAGVAALAGFIQVRSIELLDDRIDDAALLESINRAAVAVAARGRRLISG